MLYLWHDLCVTNYEIIVTLLLYIVTNTLLIAGYVLFSVQCRSHKVLLVALLTSRLCYRHRKRLLDTTVPLVIDWVVIATLKIDIC